MKPAELTILIVAGTRPEIIKTAPVMIAAGSGARSETAVNLCLTGQHQTMAQEALSVFGIDPVANLEIMKPNQTLNDICEAVFGRLPQVIRAQKPDVLMVQGDTTTAMAAALCAFNMNIPVAHIEAGLRSFNLVAPYPEECNRRVISTFARYNFAPTTAAADNLRREGIPESTIHVTGNTIVDALGFITDHHPLDALARVHASIRSPFVLITAHRRESFGQGFENICNAIRTCALRFPATQFVYPVHLNPNVKGPVHALLGEVANVLLIPPVPYLQLLTLLNNCTLVLTDSGGIQEEAPSFGKYCIVMRDVTERMESVEKGLSQLVGSDPERIVAAVTRELTTPTIIGTENPYGDGRAAEKILNTLRIAN